MIVSRWDFGIILLLKQSGYMVLKNPEIIDKNKAGHKKFIEEVKPDFVN